MINENEKINSCCSSTPFYFTKYIILVIISFSILVFSMVQIIMHPTEPNVVYFSLISHIIGIYIPAPKTEK